MLKRYGSQLVIPVLAAGIWLLGIGDALAEDVPRIGLLWNTKEVSSMLYECKQNTDKSLDCEFTQTSVRKNAKPEELDSKLKQAREEFRKGGFNLSDDDCKWPGDVIEILEGRKKPPPEARFHELSELEKKDTLKMMRAMVQFCKSKTEEDYLNIIRLRHDKDSRTCRVSSNPYKQTFRFVSDNLSKNGTWVIQGQPDGPCGFVQLSRFEMDRDNSLKFVNWNYIARRATTNPQGTTLLGLSCKDFDEGEYVYDWRSKGHPIGCDYIEFAAF
jgi:hypothetical protein